jgi:Coenzyme PQQ synthesis protein D (PqqD)
MADNTQILDATVKLPKHVVYRTFVYETVVLNLESGKYHGLNPVGGRMLELLDKNGNVRAVAGRLAEEFDRPQAEIEGDLAEFCADLAERGLIELSYESQ